MDRRTSTRHLGLTVAATICALQLVWAAPVAGGVFSNMMQVYEGPPRPRADVAVLAYSGNAYSGSNVTLVGINGMLIHRYMMPHGAVRAFEFLPGHYELLTTFVSNAQMGEHRMAISFDAEAGKEYILDDAFKGKGATWRPEIVERAPAVDPKMDRKQVCWLRSVRATLVDWDCLKNREKPAPKGPKKLWILEHEGAEPKAFLAGGCRMPGFFFLDSEGRMNFRTAKITDLVPGREISLFYTDCHPDSAYGVRIED